MPVLHVAQTFLSVLFLDFHSVKLILPSAPPSAPAARPAAPAASSQIWQLQPATRRPAQPSSDRLAAARRVTNWPAAPPQSPAPTRSPGRAQLESPLPAGLPSSHSPCS